MVRGLNQDAVPPEPTLYLSVEILSGTVAETTATDKFISDNIFKNSIIETVKRRGKVVVGGDPNGTLNSGVLTYAFLVRLKQVRVIWVKNRQIWFSAERNEEEASRANTVVRKLIENYSNKEGNADIYLQTSKKRRR
jgi:hypothetical protein